MKSPANPNSSGENPSEQTPPFQPAGAPEQVSEPQPSARELELEAQLKQAEIDKQDQAEKLKEMQADYAAEKERGDRAAELVQAASSTVQGLREQIQGLEEQPKDAQSLAIKKLKDGFKAPKGEEDQLFVIETRVNGVPLPEPRINVYDPGQYRRMIVKQPGYSADIIHDPKK